MIPTQVPVTVSAYGRAGASTRVRIHDWFAHLGLPYDDHGYVGAAANGARSLIRDIPGVLAAEARLRALRNVVTDRQLLLSREATPFSNGALEASLLSRARWGVYDFDDALFHDTQGLSRRLWSKRRVWTAAVEAADVVIAGNDLLAQRAGELSANVVVIPSCVEPDSYDRKLDYDLGATPRAVWIGSRATEHLLASVTTPFLELNKRFGLRLTVISAGSQSLGALDPVIDRRPWSESTFRSDLAGADFGIMPLTDTPYTRGKCAYKLLQYAAAGLPVIGSPVGANERAIDLLGGYSAATQDEWYAAGAAVLEMSASARRAHGEKARAAVTEHYSFGAWEPRWRAAMGLPDGSGAGAGEVS